MKYQTIIIEVLDVPGMYAPPSGAEVGVTIHVPAVVIGGCGGDFIYTGRVKGDPTNA